MKIASPPLSLAQKLEIQSRAAHGEHDPQIADAMHLSLWTVRKWRRKLRGGRSALSVVRGRPPRGALSTFPAMLRETLQQWRQTHPGWGPDTLLARLRQAPVWREQPLPHRSQIARFLKERGWTRRYQRHSPLPQPSVRSVQHPHEEWEIDAQAAQAVRHLGWVILLNVVDLYSRIKITCQAVVTSHRQGKATAADHQLALRRSFMRCGLPERLAVDHDSVYYDRSPSPFPTRLHLWLIALGVDLVFGRFRQATDQATVERTHQTMTQQGLCGEQFTHSGRLQPHLDATVDFVNTHLPCRTLGHQPPVVACPEALRVQRLYRPEYEAEWLQMQRVYAYLAQGHWFRRVSANGWICLGEQRYKVGKVWAKHQVEITFDPASQQLIVKAESGIEIQRLAPKGLTPEDLMGEAAPLMTLPSLQLALPWTPADWRQCQLAALMRGTI